VLRDFLLADEDWDLTARAYANEHDRYYNALHTWEDWYTTFFFDRGEQADARRAKAMPTDHGRPQPSSRAPHLAEALRGRSSSSVLAG